MVRPRILPTEFAMTQYSMESSVDHDSMHLVEQLVDFDGPPDQFLVEMLAAHCHGVGASAAALLRPGGAEQVRVAAVYPGLDEQQPAPEWLQLAVAAVSNTENPRSAILCPMREDDDLYGQEPRQNVLILPLRRNGRLRGAAAYHFAIRDRHAIERARQQLNWAVGLLSLYELRLTLQQQTAARRSLEMAQQVLAEVNGHRKFQAAAMAMCNDLANRCEAHRVSLGFLRGRYVKVVAMSHTEKFTRKMQIIQDLEAAMEESLDQDLEVIHPAPDDSTAVTRGVEELSRRHGPSAVVSVPIRYGDEAVAVLTLEREAERPWSWNEVMLLRLVCELCAARLVELHDRDRWVGAKAARQIRDGAAALVGPRHTWLKLAAVALLGLAIFLTFAKGIYRVDAPFVIEAVHQRAIPSPFEGRLQEVHVEPGDRVIAGETVLAELHTEDIELELNATRAQWRRHLREADIAMRKGDQAERQMAQAEADEAKARIELYEHRLENARIVSPIDGVVLLGRYHRSEGAPVSKGDVLFEIAPLESLRATLMVPEDRIMELLADVSERGTRVEAKPLEGQIATAAAPGRRIPIVVESVNPMAEVIDNRNVFRVHAELDADDQTLRQLRPNMEGLAKVDIGTRRYAWIWTRDLVNWIRMKFWI